MKKKAGTFFKSVLSKVKNLSKDKKEGEGEE